MFKSFRFSSVLAALFVAAQTTIASAEEPAQGTPAPTGDAVTLRLNLAQGQSYVLHTLMQQKLSQTIEGKRMDITTDMKMGMSMKVVEVDADGNMSIDTHYTSLVMKTSGDMGGQKISMSYDSARPQQNVNPQLKILSALLDQSLILKMTPTGQVKEIQGLDKMWKNMIAKMSPPKGIDRAAYEKSMKSLQDQFGEQNFRNMSNSMAAFPTNAVRIGDSWSKSGSMNAGFPVSTQSKYTLQSLENGIANINVQSILQMASGKSGIAGPNVKFSMSGTQTGTLTVDRATGWTNKADVEYRFSARISMPHPDRSGKTMSWPMYMKGTVKLETVPAPDAVKVAG